MKTKFASGITAKNIRSVEVNIERWLRQTAKPLEEDQRKFRNRSVSLVRSMIDAWRAGIRHQRRIKKRHLRSERAKQRRSGR